MAIENSHYDWSSLGSDDTQEDLPYGMERYDGQLSYSNSPRLARCGYTLVVRKEDADSINELNSQLKFLKGTGMFIEIPVYHADGVLEFQLMADEGFFQNFNRQFNVLNTSNVPNALGDIFKRLFLARPMHHAEENEALFRVIA